MRGKKSTYVVDFGQFQQKQHHTQVAAGAPPPVQVSAGAPPPVLCLLSPALIPHSASQLHLSQAGNEDGQLRLTTGLSNATTTNRGFTRFYF